MERILRLRAFSIHYIPRVLFSLKNSTSETQCSGNSRRGHVGRDAGFFCWQLKRVKTTLEIIRIDWIQPIPVECRHLFVWTGSSFYRGAHMMCIIRKIRDLSSHENTVRILVQKNRTASVSTVDFVNGWLFMSYKNFCSCSLDLPFGEVPF